MRIFLFPSWYPSPLHPESGTFFYDRAKLLIQQGYEIIIVVSLVHSFRDITKFREIQVRPNLNITESGIKIYFQESINLFPKFPRLAFIQYKGRMRRLYRAAVDREGTPDVGIANSSLWAGAALADIFSDRIPLIVTEHLKEFMFSDQLTFFQRKSIERCYRRAIYITIPSTAMKKNILNLFPEFEPKVLVFPDPVSEVPFSQIKHNESKGAVFRFITVAFMREEKRLEILLRAFSIVHGRYPNTSLTLIGNGPEWNQLHKLVRELKLKKSLIFTGRLEPDEIASEYENSDAFVLSSQVETFGIALVEAQFAGLPAVATRCGGPEDIITAQSGILVPINDIKALANGMQKLYLKYESYNSERIREMAIEAFGEGKFLERSQRLFRNIFSQVDSEKRE